ncbi:7182_t:CDS:2 [Funneliformis geosporum]|uniref:4375_t:CDS:1 n=1 Tax=Funneliformis geosporum TaxID=1117311 RepID=A0A9W4WJS9_9GLOM|nr:4375_t:CDS:2 [Funneliformis geosporum]CAI2169002.1 7182_t:CDS:2 [Funneliformis geosporum]
MIIELTSLKIELSLEKRYEIVFLREHPAGPMFSFGQIAKVVRCSKSTAIFWVKKYHENRDLSIAERLATQIQKNIKEHDVRISVETVRRHLRESGGKFTNEISKPLLTEAYQKKRLQWAKKHKNFDWNQVVFTDERFGKLYSFQRNLNANFIYTIYEQGLLTSTSKLFGKGNIDWILQEDNDLKYRSKIAKKWKEENSIKELSWPLISPDQNPIGNMWWLMKLIYKKKSSQLEV